MSGAESIIDALEFLGLAGVFVAMIVFAPETVMPFLGYAAAQGAYHPLAMLVAGSLGGTLGSTLIYAAARWLGRERLIEWLSYGGRWSLFYERDVIAIDRLFQRYGVAIIFFGRFLPTVRSVVSVPAGLLPMPLPKFVFFTFLGTAAWNAVLVAGGYLAGANWERLVEYLGVYGTLAAFACGVAVIAFVLVRLRNLTLGH